LEKRNRTVETGKRIFSRLGNICKTIIVTGLLLYVYSVNAIFVGTTLGELHDFGSFIAAGQLSEAGENPYSSDSPLVFNVTFKGIALSGDAPNLNPPISVVIFKQIANIDPFVSINTWRIISVLLFTVSIILLQHTYKKIGTSAIFRIAWAVSLAGFWHTIQLGQLYCFLLLLAVLTYVFIKNNKEIPAGIILGLLIAFKPNIIFWAFALLAAGRWKTFLSAGFTGLLVSLIPVATNGFEIYSQWLEASKLFTPVLLLFPGNNSFQGLTARIGEPVAGILLGAILSLSVLWHIYKHRPVDAAVNALGVTISLLISPIAWTGYTLLLLPVFFEIKKWNWKYYVSAVIFSVPVVHVLDNFKTSMAGFTLFGWFYGWGLLVLLCAIIFSSKTFTGKKEEITNNIQTN